MFSPFSAFTGATRGFEEGYTDPKLMNQIGLQALGRALQTPMAGDAEQGPQPPPPGQASVPMRQGPPPQQMPPQQAQGPLPMPPEMQGGSMAQQPVALQGGLPSGAGGPPGMSPGGPQSQSMPQQGMPSPPPQMQQTPHGLMPQFDLQTLIQRVHQANPGLPPQAMVAALQNAAPLLTIQGKHDLQMLQLQQKYDNMQLRQDMTTQIQNAATQRWQERNDAANTRNENTNATRRDVVGQQQEGANTRNTERVEGANTRNENTLASREGEGAANRTSREGIATRAEEGRQGRFVTREGRLDDQFNRTYDRLVTNAQQRWDMNEKKLQQAMTLANTREGRMAAARQLRTLEQEALANHRAVTEKIQAGFLPNAKDKNALIVEANAKRDAFMAKIEQYRTQLREGGAPQQEGAPAAPAGPPQSSAPQGRPRVQGPGGPTDILEWDGKSWVPAQ